MTVESDYAIAIATLNVWLQNVSPAFFFNQWEAKLNPIVPCARDFPVLWASHR